MKVNQIRKGESVEGEKALELSHETFQALKVSHRLRASKRDCQEAGSEIEKKKKITKMKGRKESISSRRVCF